MGISFGCVYYSVWAGVFFSVWAGDFFSVWAGVVAGESGIHPVRFLDTVVSSRGLHIHLEKVCDKSHNCKVGDTLYSSANDWQ